MNAPPNSVFSPGLVLQKRYRLQEPLAVGGMAEVWRGVDAVLQRPVAIKLLHPHLAADTAIAERFRREAISAARLSHPHIVPTYDTGTENGVSFIVLGLIQGSTLAQVLRNRKVGTREAAAIGRQVASALEHAHQAGLIHRDIKPSNILLVDNEQRVMVADFGIAKAIDGATDPSLTLPGFVVGTPAYVAPERAAGSEADARTDVYAVGVLLHEMLCCHTSFDQPTALSSTTQEADTPHCPTLPNELRRIVERATSPDPSARFQTASELCDALETVERSLEANNVSSYEGNRSDRGPHASAASSTANSTPAATTDSTLLRPEVQTPVPPSANVLRPRSRDGKRRIPMAVIVVLVLVAGAVALGRTLSSMGNSSTTTTTAMQPVTIAAARSFDPDGSDKTENDAQATLAFDGQTASAWSTETYATRSFGNLKTGVGLIVRLDREAALKSLTVDSTSRHWNAEIRLASGDIAPSNLAGWSAPVDGKTQIDGGAAFNLGATRAAWVLIWITDLGDSNRVSINEMRVLA